jgi:hypothetical protein
MPIIGPGTVPLTDKGIVPESGQLNSLSLSAVASMTEDIIRLSSTKNRADRE